MCLPKFDTYQSAVVPNCFKSHTNSWCVISFKKILSDVGSEIHLVPTLHHFNRTVCSGFKKNYVKNWANDELFLWINLHKVFYKKNYYWHVIFKRTVLITIKTVQSGLHQVGALKRFTKGALIKSFRGAPCAKSPTRKKAKEIPSLMELSKVLIKFVSKTISAKSIRLRMFFKIGTYKNLANFTGKHLCWNLFLINLQAWRPTILIKRDPNTGVSCENCKIFKNTFLTEQVRCLFLTFSK